MHITLNIIIVNNTIINAEPYKADDVLRPLSISSEASAPIPRANKPLWKRLTVRLATWLATKGGRNED